MFLRRDGRENVGRHERMPDNVLRPQGPRIVMLAGAPVGDVHRTAEVAEQYFPPARGCGRPARAAANDPTSPAAVVPNRSRDLAARSMV
jgi:hypothetical protein